MLEPDARKLACPVLRGRATVTWSSYPTTRHRWHSVYPTYQGLLPPVLVSGGVRVRHEVADVAVPLSLTANRCGLSRRGRDRVLGGAFAQA
jgi:hypothetical protein